MADDYEYDVFVSYRRKQPMLGWVKNHFYPLLLEFLDFDKEVQAVASELAAMIQKAPAWNDWPIVTPSVDKRVPIQGARL